MPHLFLFLKLIILFLVQDTRGALTAAASFNVQFGLEICPMGMLNDTKILRRGYNGNAKRKIRRRVRPF